MMSTWVEAKEIERSRKSPHMLWRKSPQSTLMRGVRGKKEIGKGDREVKE